MEQAQPQEAVPKSITEVFDREFPYYLSIGMSYDEYWHGEVWLTTAYYEAHKLRMKQINANAHLQGMYIYEALLDVSPILHAFAPKGTKPIEYRNEPYDLFGEKKKEQPKLTEQQEALRARIYMDQMFRHFKGTYGDKTGNAKKPGKPVAEKAQATEATNDIKDEEQELKDDVQTPSDEKQTRIE